MTAMSTFFHDQSLQMGLHKTNCFEKTVGQLNTLDANQTAEGNIKGLENRLQTAPLQAEGRASLAKMPRVWGDEDVQAHGCCYAVMSKQVTAAL